MSRTLLLTLLCAAAIAGAGALFALSSDSENTSAPLITQASDYSTSPESPEEIIWGNKTAPVTIIEYASMTCNHCAAFHIGTFPELKEKYIDTGLVQLRLRPFPIDAFAMRASMLMSCVAPVQKQGFAQLLFARQSRWITAPDIEKALQDLAKQAGLSEDDVTICNQNDDIFKRILAVRDHAAKELRVQSTPTFFINGRRVEGNHSFSAFEKNIIPFLPDTPEREAS